MYFEYLVNKGEYEAKKSYVEELASFLTLEEEEVSRYLWKLMYFIRPFEQSMSSLAKKNVLYVYCKKLKSRRLLINF